MRVFAMRNIAYYFSVAAISIQQAVGFTNGIHNHHAQYSQLFSTTEESAEISTTEEATVSNSQTMQADNFLSVSPMDDITKDMQMDDISSDTTDLAALSVKAISAAAFIGLLSSTSIPSTFISTYSALLLEHPLPTKSITSGILCGISDIIAQLRDQKRREFNYARLVRFAGKGCIGGVIWSFWYDGLDGFLDINNENINIYKLLGTTSGGGQDMVNLDWIKEHLAIVTTALSILLEQFIWCPLVFSLFEIPVSTLLNSGSLSKVKEEVDAKLGGLLIANAKVWTPANMIIYNVPVEWRPAVSNVVDVLWQSIVSDVAADCGTTDDDICETEEQSAEVDYSIFAKKSRM